MVELLHTGDRDAAADLLQTFLPGTCFLIRRRLGKPDVETEARWVLDTAFRQVQEESSV
jgi:hypothetical protein